MTDQSQSERAEAAAIRRRWITLGELLAVVAVLISGLTLWNSYSERSHAEADRQAADRKAEKVAVTLVLKATRLKDGSALTLSPVDATQTIQSQHILFPTALGIGPEDTTGDPRIEAGWITDAVRRGDRPHDRDLRLPIAITTRFVSADGETADATSLYHLGYRIEGHLFGSNAKLVGLSLIGKVAPAAAQKRIDALAAS